MFLIVKILAMRSHVKPSRTRADRRAVCGDGGDAVGYECGSIPAPQGHSL